MKTLPLSISIDLPLYQKKEQVLIGQHALTTVTKYTDTNNELKGCKKVPKQLAYSPRIVN